LPAPGAATRRAAPLPRRIQPPLARAQTWEDSELADHLTGLPGDNDPLDFIDVGGAAAPIGAVYDVKVLGALGLIDANETDYKVRCLPGPGRGGAGARRSRSARLSASQPGGMCCHVGAA
jgi:hypothetical protein